jgi:hypothetical protein
VVGVESKESTEFIEFDEAQGLGEYIHYILCPGDMN